MSGNLDRKSRADFGSPMGVEHLSPSLCSSLPLRYLMATRRLSFSFWTLSSCRFKSLISCSANSNWPESSDWTSLSPSSPSSTLFVSLGSALENLEVLAALSFRSWRFNPSQSPSMSVNFLRTVEHSFSANLSCSLRSFSLSRLSLRSLVSWLIIGLSAEMLPRLVGWKIRKLWSCEDVCACVCTWLL